MSGKVGGGQQLPATWIWTVLGDLGRWVGGGTPSKAVPEYWTNGTVPWVSPKDMKSFEIHDAEDHITEDAITGSATSKVPAGTVLMVTRSGILRHTFPVAVSRLPVALNQDIKGLIPHEGINPTFVAYALRSLAQTILHNCSKGGTTVESIESDAMKRVNFPLAPSSEQSRIADALDEVFSDLDAGVAALERVRSKLKLYRASVLKAAFEGTLTADWRARHPHTEPAIELLRRLLVDRRRRWEEDQLAKFQVNGQVPPKNWKARYTEPVAPEARYPTPLPEGWCSASLDQLFQVERGRFSIRPRNDPRYYGGKVPFVQIGELPREGGSINAYHKTLNEQGVAVSKRFPAGTVLIAIVGATIGNTGILTFDSCCPDSLVALQSPMPLMLRFVELYLRTRKMVLRKTASASGGQPNINLEVLQPFVMPLPPEAELESIVEAAEDQLSVIDHLEADLGVKLKAAQSLRQSLLHHAFSGKLVPQDPNDQPAFELLNRIAAARRAHTREAVAAKRPANHAVTHAMNPRGRPKKHLEPA